MRLLVSVATAADAVEAAAGGADFIDAKDPHAGALGAVSHSELRRIVLAVGGTRRLTAALGDATSADEIERTAREFAADGVALVKIGFAGTATIDGVAPLVEAAIRGARASDRDPCGVVVVAYADAEAVGSITATALLDVAIRAGASGVMIDTANKLGPGLCRLMPFAALAAWVARGHDAGLLVALAGQVSAHDLGALRDTGADIVGVRGAACVGGRGGRVSADRVRLLAELCRSPVLSTDPARSER